MNNSNDLNTEIAPRNDKPVVCLRTNHNEGYVELALLESSHQAVDELILHLKVLVQEHTSPLKLRIFVNPYAAGQALPIVYLLRQLRVARSQLKAKRPIRIAAGFYFLPLAHLLEAFLRTLRTPNVRMKAFGVHQREAAIAWLLRDD